ncbi:hypothetical protein JOD63_002969 [Microbacterium terrae]|uniref:phosphotransferase n=1 Tax=Microbacterium terrae TaxID=69369 RepID=UPI0005EC2138|nr:phosphotransferase [Microbacterium terrae]MBP1079001.1 hypothetical protein [Microbacterium terrae]GLJ98401.1 hypothetical protein GCM10017594_15980 [Microbacterium terrae]
MRAHPIWPNLLVHDDDELGDQLGGPVTSRVRVHEWPLTVTDRVILDDGRAFAYKAQLPPSIEVEFYAAARGSLLPPHIEFPRIEGSAGRWIATEWISSPSLRELVDDPAFGTLTAAASIAERACAEISLLDPRLPVLRDIGGVDAWRTLAARTLDGLAREVDAQRYPGVHGADVRRLRDWSESLPVLAAVDTEAVIQHGDLTGHEVFPMADGPRVIDWQRPVRGPRGIDLANLLHDIGIDPRSHVDEALVQISRFLLIDWAVDASTEILPGADPAIPGSWVRQALVDFFTS